MTVQATEPSTPPAEPATPADPPKPAEPDWKALARQWETRAKENKSAADKLAEIEAANQTEAEKAAAKAAAAEERATQAELRALRLEVAAEKGLTPAQAKRLVGSTREELEADAAELLDTFKAGTPAPVTPRPDPSQGTRGGTVSLGREAGLEAARKRFPEKYQTN